MRRRKVLIVISAIIVLIIFAPFVMGAIFSFFSYLSRPKDLQAAKNRGLSLLKLKGQTVMFVGAHPDDVDWYVGGTLSVLREQGNKVVVVVATSGEKGGNGAKNLAKMRESEQLKAANIMGYDEIEFLRLPDGSLEADGELIRKLKALIAKYKPTVFFTFDVEKENYIYRHPDHRASGIATIKALEDHKESFDLYLFHSRANNTIFDVTKAQPLKIKALAAHASQRNLRFSRIMRYLPFSLLKFGRAGAAANFEEIGIEYGEIFRYSR